jgi:hypothetical protein
VVLKPVIAFCFAVGFATLGSSSDLRGVVAGFVTLLVAALAWPLLARFMPFTTAGSGHSALAGMVSTGAGLLAGRRMSGGGAGPAGYPGTEYARAVEAQNEPELAATSARVGGLTTLTGHGGGSAGGAASAAGGMAGGVGAAVGAAATVAAAAVDHVESQLSSAAADAGLGHATRPAGGYGHTRGRFGGPHHQHRHGGHRDDASRPPGGSRESGQHGDATGDADLEPGPGIGTDHVDGDGDVGGPAATDLAGVEVEPDGTRP